MYPVNKEPFRCLSDGAECSCNGSFAFMVAGFTMRDACHRPRTVAALLLNLLWCIPALAFDRQLLQEASTDLEQPDGTLLKSMHCFSRNTAVWLASTDWKASSDFLVRVCEGLSDKLQTPSPSETGDLQSKPVHCDQVFGECASPITPQTSCRQQGPGSSM